MRIEEKVRAAISGEFIFCGKVVRSFLDLFRLTCLCARTVWDMLWQAFEELHMVCLFWPFFANVKIQL
jgi:hypothetical protein